MKSPLAFLLVASTGLAFSAHAVAQESPPPATGTFPAQQPAPAQPAPGQPPPAQPAPATQPAPAPAPPPAGYAEQPPPAAQQPPPAYGQQPPPANQQQTYPPPQGYGQQTYGPPQDQYQYESPPPPPSKPDEGFKMPPWSARIDPFNWLLEGRLGLELEVGLLKWMSVEIVPVFVVNDQPPMLNFSGIEDTLYQSSNGLGALAGSSLSVGFWLEGKALEGYVLRAILTNYGYTYETKDDAGRIDLVNHTERHFYGYLGSHSNFGAFTIAGGIGLGVELNKQQRCYPQGAISPTEAQTTGCDDAMEILVTRDGLRADLNSPIHPIQIMGRFSLGVVID